MHNSASGIVCADLVVAGIRRFSATPSVWSIVSSPSTVADFRCGCCHAVYALAACPPRRALPVCTNCGPTLDSSGRRADPRCADQGGIRARGRRTKGSFLHRPTAAKPARKRVCVEGRRGVAGEVEESLNSGGGGVAAGGIVHPAPGTYPPLLSTPPPPPAR